MAFEYTVRRAAEVLGISESRIHQLIQEGILPAEKIAGRYFLDEDAVEARATVTPKPGRPANALPKNPKPYTLMNRNYEVFDFIYDDSFDEFDAIGEVYDISRAPLGLTSPRGSKISLSALTYWWKHRSIPHSRAGLSQKLAELGINDPTKLPFKSLGLSLSDQYWIKPQGQNIDWHSINFFTNKFADMVEMSWLDHVGLESPDNTSEGLLSKRWIQKNGKSYLLKGAASLDQEPYNEAVATALYKRLLNTDDYVTYKIKNLKHGGVASICENFLSDKEEYIPAFYILKTKTKAPGIDDYKHYVECCLKLKVNNIKELLAKMIATDDILANTDRHLRNFGLIRNVETLEYKPAPLFDTGTSLFCGKSEGDLKKGELSFTTKPFSDNPNQQLRLVSDFSWFDANALDGFVDEATEILAKNPKLKGRLKLIRNQLNTRIERLKIVAS